MGKKFYKKEKYNPYLFVNANSDYDTPYKTIKNKPVARMDFDSIFEAREFIKQKQNLYGYPVYGLESFAYTYIYDNYKNIEYDTSLLNISIFDIEVSMEGGYPDIELADKEITAITLINNQKGVSLGYYDYIPDDDKMVYLKCEDEKDLLIKFIEIWESESWLPDVISGWNTDRF